MRVLLIGKETGRIAQLATECGLKIVEDDSAQAAICYGGDGTLLGAERDFPGLPKIPIRQRDGAGDEFAPMWRRIFSRVAQGRPQALHLPKLRAEVRGETLLGLNDILIRNISVTSAVRLSVAVDGVPLFREIVGDGLVVSTPFGSSAYYRAITNSVIHVGIGLAFNNSTEPVNHLVLSASSRIEVAITRGPAVLGVDNNPRQITLESGDVVRVSQSEHVAVLWEVDNLLLMDSRAVAGDRRLRWLFPFTGWGNESGRRLEELRRQFGLDEDRSQ